MTDKKTIRNILLQRRQALSYVDYTSFSDSIAKRLLSLDVVKQASVIHCYVSMNQRHEPDTLKLIETFLSLGKQVLIPVMEVQTVAIRHALLTSLSSLKNNKWGVLEPESFVEQDASKIDLIIVPMVGADEHRNRVGYGKGFYDRFLENMNRPALGLCFETCVVDVLPIEDFDQKMNMIITEKRIIL